MKQLTFSLFIFLSTFSFSQIEETSTLGMNLNGDVEKVIEIQYENHDLEQINKTTTYTFDEKGNLISVQQIKPDGTGYTHQLYYTEDFMLVKDELTFSGLSSKAINKHEYNNWLRVKTTRLQIGNDGKTTTSKIQMLYTYSDDNQLTSEQEIDKNGEESTVTTYAYDENGQLESKLFSEYGQPITKTSYTYIDEKTTSVSIIDYEYDETTIGEIHYDEFGNEIHTSEGSFSNDTSYKYDDHKNWINKLEYYVFDNEVSPGYALTREIIYFE